MTTAWIFGGTGAIGSAVVRDLSARGIQCVFTYFSRETEATALARKTGAAARRFDARDIESIASWTAVARNENEAPDAIVYAAAVSDGISVFDLTSEQWDQAMRINVMAPCFLLRALAASMKDAPRPCDVVLLGALDRGQSLPLPAHFAATQGALAAMAMALAGELGPYGFRINVLAAGVLDEGLSRTLKRETVEAYLQFSALRRIGRAEEIARAVAWLAFENRYMTGRVIPVNGGI